MLYELSLTCSAEILRIFGIRIREIRGGGPDTTATRYNNAQRRRARTKNVLHPENGGGTRTAVRRTRGLDPGACGNARFEVSNNGENDRCPPPPAPARSG